MASLVAVKKMPLAETIFGWWRTDKISNSFWVSTRFCFLLLINLTATSSPLRICWQRRTTEKRPRPTILWVKKLYISQKKIRIIFRDENVPSSSSSIYWRSKSLCQKLSRFDLELWLGKWRSFVWWDNKWPVEDAGGSSRGILRGEEGVLNSLSSPSSPIWKKFSLPFHQFLLGELFFTICSYLNSYSKAVAFTRQKSSNIALLLMNFALKNFAGWGFFLILK